MSAKYRSALGRARGRPQSQHIITHIDTPGTERSQSYGIVQLRAVRGVYKRNTLGWCDCHDDGGWYQPLQYPCSPSIQTK